MYIPKYYVGKDQKEAIAFMQRFNFGLITTSTNEAPVATHLPFVISERDDKIILSSHLAKANPHSDLLASNENLIVFSEPHAYISPSLYEKEQNVPTWNYIAVHAYGKARIIEEQKAVFLLLEEMMDFMEPAFKQQWQSLNSEYKSRLSKAIVGFEIEVSKLQFKKKLSQNKTEQEKENIINSLKTSPNSNEQHVAEYMKKN